MNKELEALRRIKKSHFIAMLCLTGENRDIETENALETIEQALKRNEPMKVDVGFFDYCPKCRTTLRRIYNYCYNCGQKIDWSDDEKERKKQNEKL